MPRLKAQFPSLLGNCVLLPVDVAFIPLLGGLLERMTWRSYWVDESAFEQGREYALCLMEGLGMGDCTFSIIEAIQECCAGQTAAILELSEALQLMQLQMMGFPTEDEAPLDVERGVGDPPDESETWGDFNEAYCNRAGRYLDEIQTRLDECLESLEATGVLSAATLGAILLAGGITIPAAILVGLSAALVLFLLKAELDTISDAYAAAKADLLCAVYLATTPDGLYDTLQAYEFGEGAEVDFILHSYFSQADINSLWEGDEWTVGEEFNCAACGIECEEGAVIFGTLTAGGFDQGYVTVSSEFNVTNCYSHYRVFADICSNWSERTFHISALTGFTPKTCQVAYNWTVRCKDEGGGGVVVDEGQNETPPLDVEWCANFIQLMSETAFTVTITFDDEACLCE